MQEGTDHYVSNTGDYDCAADEHIEGCGIVDKRAADEHGETDPYDAAERDLVEYIGKHRGVLLGIDVDLGTTRGRVDRCLHVGTRQWGRGTNIKTDCRRINLDG